MKSADECERRQREILFLRSELRQLQAWLRTDRTRYPGGRRLADAMIARINNALKERIA